MNSCFPNVARSSSEEQVGECWLKSTRVARRAGNHQTAFNALLNAENSHLSELFVEKAKWLWSKVCFNYKTIPI